MSEAYAIETDVNIKETLKLNGNLARKFNFYVKMSIVLNLIVFIMYFYRMPKELEIICCKISIKIISFFIFLKFLNYIFSVFKHNISRLILCWNNIESNLISETFFLINLQNIRNHPSNYIYYWNDNGIFYKRLRKNNTTF